MSELILALMMILIPPKYQAEDEADARERYYSIATEIAWATNDDQRLALFLLTIARHESSFRYDIHNGDKLGDHGRSWGLFQILCGTNRNADVPKTAYKAHQIIGVDTASTARAVDAAVIIVRPLVESCGGRPMCVFKAYGGIGKNVDEKTRTRLVERVTTYKRLNALARREYRNSPPQ